MTKDRKGASLPDTCQGPLRVGGVVESRDCPNHNDLHQCRANRISAAKGPRPRKGLLAEGTREAEAWGQLGRLGLGPRKFRRAPKAGPPTPTGETQGGTVARALELCDSRWDTILQKARALM